MIITVIITEKEKDQDQVIAEIHRILVEQGKKIRELERRLDRRLQDALRSTMRMKQETTCR